MKIARDRAVTSHIMSKIKARDTEPERLLGKAMWTLGLRYRKQWKIMGKPDFAFPGLKIAVFCDGDFWHGNNWRVRKRESFAEEIAEYSPFWQSKIQTNIGHDEAVNQDLFDKDWIVIRFWESTIRKNPKACAKNVLNTVFLVKRITTAKT